MSADRLILHLGTHKTGTTAVQEALGANTAPLSQVGLNVVDDASLFGRGHPGAAHRIAAALIGEDPAPRRQLTRLIQAKQLDKGQRILSSEVLWRGLCTGMMDAKTLADRLMMVFGDIAMDHVLFVRDFGGFINSMTAEIILATSTPDTPDAIASGLRAYLDVYARLLEFGEVFGAQHVHAQPYELARRTEGGVVGAAFAAAGLDPEILPEVARSRVTHAMLPADLMALKLAMNRSSLDEQIYSMLRFRLPRLAERRDATTPYRIVSDAILAPLIEESKQLNGGLADHLECDEQYLFSEAVLERPLVDITTWPVEAHNASLIDLVQELVVK